ncbi:MAG TPA: DUF2249 domain-containing protein [Puia sp.]|nr:DUF2249 domain-containing protein [Puia sp.]
MTTIDNHTQLAVLLAHRHVLTFDVREMLAGGNDPLKEILQKYRSLKEDGALCIINTFVPLPLIRLLENQQAQVFTETVGPGEYRTYFLPSSGEKSPVRVADAGILMEDERSFEAACTAFRDGRMKEIDVRALEMPQPMQEILAALERLPRGHALYVYHKRVPVHLLEALAEQAYEVHIARLSEKDVRLLIIKN